MMWMCYDRDVGMKYIKVSNNHILYSRMFMKGVFFLKIN